MIWKLRDATDTRFGWVSQHDSDVPRIGETIVTYDQRPANTLVVTWKVVDVIWTTGAGPETQKASSVVVASRISA